MHKGTGAPAVQYSRSHTSQRVEMDAEFAKPKVSCCSVACTVLTVAIVSFIGGVVIADLRVQSGDQHETPLDKFGDSLSVWFNAQDAIVGEAPTRISEKAY